MLCLGVFRTFNLCNHDHQSSISRTFFLLQDWNLKCSKYYLRTRCLPYPIRPGTHYSTFCLWFWLVQLSCRSRVSFWLSLEFQLISLSIIFKVQPWGSMFLISLKCCKYLKQVTFKQKFVSHNSGGRSPRSKHWQMWCLMKISFLLLAWHHLARSSQGGRDMGHPSGLWHKGIHLILQGMLPRDLSHQLWRPHFSTCWGLGL